MFWKATPPPQDPDARALRQSLEEAQDRARRAEAEVAALRRQLEASTAAQAIQEAEEAAALAQAEAEAARQEAEEWKRRFESVPTSADADGLRREAQEARQEAARLREDNARLRRHLEEQDWRPLETPPLPAPPWPPDVKSLEEELRDWQTRAHEAQRHADAYAAQYHFSEKESGEWRKGSSGLVDALTGKPLEKLKDIGMRFVEYKPPKR